MSIQANGRIMNRPGRSLSVGQVPRRVLFNPSASVQQAPVNIPIIRIPAAKRLDVKPKHTQSILFRLNSAPVTQTESDKQFVSETYYNAKLAEKIARMAPKLHVDFSYWNLIDQDMLMIISEIIVKQKCTELWLYGNRLTSHGVSLLALGLMNNSTLTSLDLSFNRLSNLGVWALTQVLLPTHLTAVRSLFLSKNGIANQGAIHLAEMLKTNQTLTELWLSNNEIGNQGVQQLAQVLATENKTLKFLSLSMNPFITDACVDALVHLCETNRTLKRLWIKDCNLTESGKTRLRNSVNGTDRVKIEV